MRNSRFLIPAALLLAAAMPALGEQPVAFEMTGLRLAEADTDHLRVAFHASVRGIERAVVRRVFFSNMQLCGQPVFLAPVEDRLELLPGTFVQIPGELSATLYFRDLESPEPLREALETGRMRVSGEVTADLDLSLMQKMALAQKGAQFRTSFHSEVPLSIPGGELGRNAALLALKAAGPLFGMARKAGAVAPKPPDWAGQQCRRFGSNLLLVVTRYRIRSKRSGILPFTHTSLGFRLGRDRAVVLKEALAPWEFNPEVMSRIKGEKGKLLEKETDLRIFFAGQVIAGGLENPANGLSMAARQVRVVESGRKQSRKSVLRWRSATKVASLADRLGRGNIAVLELAVPAAGAAPLAPPPDQNSYFERLAVLRFRRLEPGRPLEAEAISVRGRRDGDNLELLDPVTNASYGSPVVTPSGVLAIVQDEHKAALLGGLSEGGMQ